MMTRSAKDAKRDDAAIEESKGGQQHPGQPQDPHDALEAQKKRYALTTGKFSFYERRHSFRF